MQRLLGPGAAGSMVVVGFSPPEAMARLGDHLGLRCPVLSDPERRLYRLLGLPRAHLWQVYSPGTVARYARLVASGRRLRPAVEDTRQMGGDALLVDGVVRRVWRPATPDDRVAPSVVVAALRDLPADGAGS